MHIIDNFTGNWGFLSNFSPDKVDFHFETYPTSEHLYQALKTFDLEEREVIRNALTPGKAKRMGRKVKIRSNWEMIKNDYMYGIILLKFKQNEDIKKKLLSTLGYRLIEGNTWHDNYWGDCRCKKCENKVGKNMLGKVLMTIRSELNILEGEK